MGISVSPNHALAYSRFVTRQFRAHPEWQAEVEALAKAPLTLLLLEQRLAKLRGEQWQDEAHLKAGLRQCRNFWLCAVALRDLEQGAPLSEVMLAMSLLADVAISSAVDWLSLQLGLRHGIPSGAESGDKQQFLVVAMGKLGAFELNVSSDVDLIFLYREEGETAGAAGLRLLPNEDFFTRLARRLINVLADVTADGYVFRVDMRLRPNGESGALVCSFSSLEEYLMVQGRTWERLAWIKARLIGEDAQRQAAALQLARLVEPFVYRKYLDFSAIAALRDLHDEIRAEARRREARHPEHATNVKLGRGGIREIEFIAQHMQLIRGGRDKALRTRATEDVLGLLAERDLLKGSVVRQLIRTYRLLRAVEHRLQYRDDLQTHVLPCAQDELEALVAMCANLPEPPGSADALLARLAREQGFVAAQFDSLFRTGEERVAELDQPRFWGALMLRDESRDDVLTAFHEVGFRDAEGAYRQLQALWSNPRVRRLPSSAQDRFERLVPAAIELAVQHATAGCDAATLLSRMFSLLEAIASRAAYLALLFEYPDAFSRVAELLAASPWAARFLIRHPLLLDELLQDPSATPALAEPSGELLDAELASAEGDVERQMDLLRETFHAVVFSLLIRDLDQRIAVEALADELAAWCDIIIAAALKWSWKSIVRGQASSRVEGPEADAPDFAVIAYGKLGGRELTYASDLDLVFLTGQSGASDSFTKTSRLAQRLISWLTTHTPAGALFEVDVRLRPDGEKGLNVATLEGFERYQRENAWVWEHQALTRARFCAGDVTLGAEFERIRRQILSQVRDLEVLKTEISSMRRRMHDAHPNHSSEFDLKHDAGGMVDIEFSVQFLILGYAHQEPGLLDNVGNIALLGRAAEAGLIDKALADEVANAYRALRFAQHRLRLAESRFARLSADQFVPERKAVQLLYNSLLLAAQPAPS
jgi:glutamate-ammonia-ligase adenylyltransferase